MKPLAVVATHPIQYQAPFFRYLHNNGCPVHVYFLSDRGLAESYDPGFGVRFAWDIPLLEGYPNEFVPNVRRKGTPEGMFGLINPGLVSRLTSKAYSGVLVHGYRNLSMLMAMLGSRSRSLPVFYRSDSVSFDQTAALSRRSMGRVLARLVSGFLTTGTLNDRFYEEIGVPSHKRFLVPHAVDNERFRRMAETTRAEARAKLNVNARELVVIYAGKFIPEKQTEMVLEAFIDVAGAGTRLLLVGDGALRSRLEGRARAAGASVTFTGFLNQTDIGLAYRSADLLVLPSRSEAWGLVVNEVMNFGVPVLVSDRVGCWPDLVIERETGAVFDHRSIGALSEALEKLLVDPGKLEAMGKRAAEHISTWDFAAGKDGVERALAAAGSRP